MQTEHVLSGYLSLTLPPVSCFPKAVERGKNTRTQIHFLSKNTFYNCVCLMMKELALRKSKVLLDNILCTTHRFMQPDLTYRYKQRPSWYNIKLGKRKETKENPRVYWTRDYQQCPSADPVGPSKHLHYPVK